MKKIVIFVLAFATSTLWAQKFEGSIKWSMKMDITDPSLKSKMDAAQNDPAMQAKMKELQEKMKDPQFKAMMENNPQVKAMIDKMAQGGGINMNSMVPKGMIVKLKDGNSLVTMDGGVTAGDFLNLNDVNGSLSVKLDRQNKTYKKLASSNNGNQPQSTVTKTSETTKVIGYNCTKYVVTQNSNGMIQTYNVWATTEIKNMDIKSLTRQKMGNGQSIFSSSIDGVPLRVESSMPQGSFVMEVTEIKNESYPDSDFKIPSDYKAE